MTSIGSTQSFWAQDQAYWSNAKSQAASSISATNSVISVIANAEANLSTGLSSLANQTALNRVNNQISSIVQQVLQSASGASGNSTTSSSGSSTTSSTAATTTSAPATKSPASLTGNVVLTPGSSLSSLGILPGGTITVSAGVNATTYTSTGTDTVGDLINAINLDLPTNAQVTASLDPKGHLVVTSRNNKDSIAIVGDGTDAAAVGFGTKNSSAQPTLPSSATSGTSSGSSSGSSSSTSSSNTGTTPATNLATQYSNALSQAHTVSAQGILTASGVKGTLFNLLT